MLLSFLVRHNSLFLTLSFCLPLFLRINSVSWLPVKFAICKWDGKHNNSLYHIRLERMGRCASLCVCKTLHDVFWLILMRLKRIMYSSIVTCTALIDQMEVKFLNVKRLNYTGGLIDICCTHTSYYIYPIVTICFIGHTEEGRFKGTFHWKKNCICQKYIHWQWHYKTLNTFHTTKNNWKPFFLNVLNPAILTLDCCFLSSKIIISLQSVHQM